MKDDMAICARSQLSDMHGCGEGFGAEMTRRLEGIVSGRFAAVRQGRCRRCYANPRRHVRGLGDVGEG